MTAFARCGPNVQTMTSPPFFSLRRRAPSRAYPSDSLTSNERSPSSTHSPSRFTRRTASLFGTCFIRTTIFMDDSLWVLHPIVDVLSDERGSREDYQP